MAYQLPKEAEILLYKTLDYAELQAKKQRLMHMKDWMAKLDAFLVIKNLPVKKLVNLFYTAPVLNL